MFFSEMFLKKPTAAERARIDQMREYLSGYPVYTPPHMANVRDLTKEEAAENFQYFLEHLPVRTEALYSFLSQYKVAPDLDDDGLWSVSTWFSEEGSLLLAYVPPVKAIHTFLCFDPKWEGKHISFNVIFDLGIFLAQCLMRRNPKLKWFLAHGGARGAGPSNTGYYLMGLKRPGSWIDPMQRAFLHCHNEARELENKKEQRPWGYLKGWVDDWASR
jgi:hypothetical protein